MSWASYHAQSEHYANLAEDAVRQGDLDHAYEYYRLAAEQEISALGQLAPSKTRTLGITFVSAASLWFKARDLAEYFVDFNWTMIGSRLSAMIKRPFEFMKQATQSMM